MRWAAIACCAAPIICGAGCRGAPRADRSRPGSASASPVATAVPVSVSAIASTGGESPPPAPTRAGPSAASAGAPPAGVRRKYAVAALGDSLTDPHSHGGKYLDVLRARCPESFFESWGKGGDMVNMMRRRFKAYVNTG